MTVSLWLPFGSSLHIFGSDRQAWNSFFMCVGLDTVSKPHSPPRTTWRRTHGTISSLSPLRNRMGVSLICKIRSSLGHTSWHRGARYFAGGRALSRQYVRLRRCRGKSTHVGIILRIDVNVFSSMMPHMSPRFMFFAASAMETAPPRLCPYRTTFVPRNSCRSRM